MMKIYINGRFLTQRLTGVQKFAYQYTNELYVQYKDNLIVLIPQKSKINNFYKNKFNVKHIGSNSGHLWEQFDRPGTLENYERVKHLYGQLQLLRIAAAGENTAWGDEHDLPTAAQLIHLVEKCFLAYRDKWKHELHYE